MEALSLTSEVVSEPPCSLALTDDSLPDDTHTLLLSALESNVHTHSPSLLRQPLQGLGWLQGSRSLSSSRSATGSHPEAPLVPQALLGLSGPPRGTMKFDRMKWRPCPEEPRGGSCERVNPDTEE